MAKRYDFVVMIPTYNRRGLLELALQQLVPAAEDAGISVYHLIFDDCSTDLGYTDMLATYKRDFYEINYFRAFTRYGRGGFCSLYTKMMEMIKPLDFAYVTATADDLIFASNFFIKAADHFEVRKREDASIVAMNLLWNKKGRSWGFTRYIDCGFICVREFFDAIEWKVPSRKKRVFNNPHTSTGVGMYMTKTLFNHPYYSVAENDGISLQEIRKSHGGVKIQSVMRPWHTNWSPKQAATWNELR